MAGAVDNLIVDYGSRKQGLPKPESLEYRTNYARVRFADHKAESSDIGMATYSLPRVTSFDIESFCVGPHNITSRVTGFEMAAKAGRVVECRFTVCTLCPLEGDVLNYCELVEEGAE